MTPGPDCWRVPPLSLLGFVIGSAPGWAMNYAVSGRILPSNAVKSVPAASLALLRASMLPNFFVGKLATTLHPVAAWTTVVAPVVLCGAYYLHRRSGDERWRATVLTIAAGVLGVACLAEIFTATASTAGWRCLRPWQCARSCPRAKPRGPPSSRAA